MLFRSDLDLPAVVHEEIAGFEIAVDDPVVVAEGDGGEELEEEGLDFGGEERSRHRGEKRLKVVLDKIHDNEDSVRSVSQLWGVRRPGGTRTA